MLKNLGLVKYALHFTKGTNGTQESAVMYVELFVIPSLQPSI